MLSRLTAQGLSDSQIQLISGDESKRSLEVYQHLSLEQGERAYQAAVRDLDTWTWTRAPRGRTWSDTGELNSAVMV
jgi:hypothetical protein